MKLTKKNCKVFAKKSGKLYLEITNEESAIPLLSTTKDELLANQDWREEVEIRQGDYGKYAILADKEYLDI